MGDRAKVGRRGVVAGGAAAVLAASAARAGPGDPLSGVALYRDVRTYVDQGDHRTGGPGDAANTRWLLRELRRAGYAAEPQAFPYPVFDLRRSDLQLGPRTFEGFPLWTPRTTPVGGLAGPLTLEGRPGGILVIVLPYDAGASLQLVSYRDPIARAAASGAAAVVAVTRNPVGEMMVLNADPLADPWPVPVIHVAGRHEAELLAAAAQGQPARLRLEGRSQISSVHNVIARRPGAGKPVVMSTPKSGWLRCAGERGSGMAIWLGLARWLAAETDYNLILLATTGHEFHGHGGHSAAEAAPTPAETRLWLHIGANVAAFDFTLQDGRLVRLPGPTTRRGVACTHDLIAAAGAAFAGQPGYATPIDIDVQRAPGEVALYHRLGYRPILGLVGAHPLHHTPRDLADVTAPEILEPVARGLQRVLRAL